MAKKANYLMSCSKADNMITNYYRIRYMIYKRIQGSHQIGNYLAGLSRQIAFPYNIIVGRGNNTVLKNGQNTG